MLPGQLIRFREQYMYRFSCGREPGQHLAIKWRQRVTHIHDKHHSAERFPRLEVSAEQVLPMSSHINGYFGVTISWKVYQKTATSQLKKIQMLGASGRFADESKAATGSQRVDCAGLSRIRPPGKGYLHPVRRRQTAQLVNSGIKRCMLKNGHISTKRVNADS